MRLDVDQIAFGYGGRLVGQDISFTLEENEVLVLFGPNGAGKTTLFKTLLGLVPLRAGTIRLDGRPIGAWSGRERASRIAYVPQAHAALFPFTVEDLVLMGRAPHVGLFATPGRRDREVAAATLERLGIGHLASRAYTEISGGERQIALIARALAQEPSTLVMDEPTASLDYGHQMRVLDRVRELAGEGVSIVLSTHNPDHAFRVADRVALVFQSRIAALGPPEAVLTADALKQLYDIDVVIGTLAGSDARLCAPRNKT
ncbi:ABC transporter ATP-binding protein [Ensifer sp.]|uniref:ABC transporter ATP-binding protein n=1 Tax=Ensifer sp. TaxID=1872086 RepID=UPI00289BB990|nr:ABC transporter ATP-binding protein [Ensifer sp.]